MCTADNKGAGSGGPGSFVVVAAAVAGVVIVIIVIVIISSCRLRLLPTVRCRGITRIPGLLIDFISIVLR